MARSKPVSLATKMARKQARDRAYAQRAAAAGLTLTDLVAMRRANQRTPVAQRRAQADARARQERLVPQPWDLPKWKAYDKKHAPSLVEKVEGKVGGALAAVANKGFDTQAKWNPTVKAALAIPGVDKVYDFSKRATAGALKDLAYMPSGVYHVATTRPDKTIHDLAWASAAPFTHPVRTYQQRPQDFAYTALALASGGASVAARTSAVRAALAETAAAGRIPTTTSRAAIVAKAALRKPNYGSRTIVLRHPITGAARTQLAMNFDGPLGRLIAKGTDRALGLDGRVRTPKQGKVLQPARYEVRSDAFPNPVFQTAKQRLANARTQLGGAYVGARKAEQVAQRVEQAVPRGFSKDLGPLTPTVQGLASSRRAFREAIVQRQQARQAFRQAEEQARARPHTEQSIVARVGELEAKQRKLVEGFMRSGEFDPRPASLISEGSRSAVVDEVRRLRKKLERLKDPRKIAETNDMIARQSQGLVGSTHGQRLYDAAADQLDRKLRDLAARGVPEARAAVEAFDELDRLKQLRTQYAEAQSGFMGTEFPGWGEIPARPQLVEAARPGLARAEQQALRARSELRQARSQVQEGRMSSWARRVERTRSAAEEARAQARSARDELRAARAELRQTPEQVTRTKQVMVEPEVRAEPLDLFKGARSVRRHLAEMKFRAEARQNERMIGNLITPEGVPGGLREPGNAFYRGLRGINRVNRGAVLYRPAYLPTNIISQEAMSLAHQGPKMAVHRAQAAMLRGTPAGKMLRLLGGKVEQLTPKQKQLLMAMSGSGRIFSTLPEFRNDPAHWIGSAGRMVERGLEKADTNIAHGFGKLVDDPYRSAAFVAELKRVGVKKNEIGRTMELAATGAKIKTGQLEARYIPEAKEATAAFDKVLHAARISNRAMIDYGRLSKNERVLRDLLFLYPWVKGAIQYTGRFPIERPFQTAAYGQLGNIGAQHTGLPGDVPSITEGSFAIGDRNVKGLGPVPIIANPSTLTPFTQPRDTYNDLAPLLPWVTGHKFTEYHNPGETLLPLYGALLKSGGDAGKVWDETSRSIPWMQLFKEPAANNPTNRLYPRNENDTLGNFFGGSWYPKPYNPVRGQAIAREEQSAGLGKAQTDAQRAKYVLEDVAQVAKTFTGQSDYTDPVVAEGLKAWQKLRAAERQVEGIRGFKRGSRLTPQGRLTAALIAQSGRKPSAAEIKEVQALSDDQAKEMLNRIKDLPLLQAQRAMRARLRQYNDVIVNSGRPYTQGGRKLQVP